MKRGRLFILLLVFSILTASFTPFQALGAASDGATKGKAVLPDLKVVGGVSQDLVNLIMDMLSERLSANFEILDRSLVRATFNDTAPLTSASQLGASVVMTGQIEKTSGGYAVSAKVINLDNGRTISGDFAMASGSEASKLVEEIALRLFSIQPTVLGLAVMGQSPVLKQGTVVPVKFVNAVDSKTAKVGDKVEFETTDDVKVGNAVIIPKGAKTEGIITQARSGGPVTRSGKFTIAVNGITGVSDIKIDIGTVLEYARNDEVLIGSGTVIGMAMLGPAVLVVPLFIKGRDIRVEAGTAVNLTTKSDITFELRFR